MVATDRRAGDLASAIPEVCDSLGELTNDPGPVADFARVFFDRAPSRLDQRGPEALAKMAFAAWRFLEATRVGQVDVAITKAEDEGWSRDITVIRTNVGERPFIVDTIREYLYSEGLAVSTLIYPRLGIERDGAGTLLRAGSIASGGSGESLVHCEVPRIDDPARTEALRAEIESRLNEVVAVTDDFTAMIARVDAVAREIMNRGRALMGREEEIAEIADFLRWLRDGGFVFLGYRRYNLVELERGERAVAVEAPSGLGILRDSSKSTFAEPVPLSKLPEDLRDLAERGPLLIINKANAESRIHRRARMDYIGVKVLDDRGRVSGEHRFLGLFTSRAYSEKADTLPILRRKLTRILRDSEAAEGTHDYKEIITIFNTLPMEELFLESAYEIAADIRTVIGSYDTADVQVKVRQDTLGRGASVMVILPKDRFSGEVRRRIADAIVGTLRGEILNYHLALGEGDQARLHFYIATDDRRSGPEDAASLEARVARIIRTWTDRVRDGLGRRISSAQEAAALADHYTAAFAAEYRAATGPEIAVGDILRIEEMKAEREPIAIALRNYGEADTVAGVSGATELKVYRRHAGIVLSEFVPILEGVGLRVLAVKPFEIAEDDGRATTINVFAVQDRDGNRVKVEDCHEILAETVLAVHSGNARGDSLNALVLAAGLAWREVDVLRGYIEYAFQVGVIPSRGALVSALVHHAGIARTLFRLFEARFDPSLSLSAEARSQARIQLLAGFWNALSEVGALADDRALRTLESLISATLRTNYYLCGGKRPTRRSGGVPYLSFKVDCASAGVNAGTGLALEVWVHSARMEGVHLRGGAVARGGIRWSDRPDDFRTEVLGLASTQMVKNAVIVPTGSKGGFVLHSEPSPEWDVQFAEGKSQYRTLIRGLLDITDNLIDGSAETPAGVVAYDGYDPYLVVAADKGTATFSDFANEVAGQYGFWLDDAFASGGSQGYDHKAVGITARGAWESVKLHFLERGKDIQTEPFTVVGIGDMGGDVFGNGMLLSKTTRLVAAFDHRHIFIDPDPDPVASYAERKRLFGLASNANWGDYDRALLSKGGMIVPRGIKEVELGPEACRALGLSHQPQPSNGDAGSDDAGSPGSHGAGSSGSDDAGPSGSSDPAADSIVIDGESLVRVVLRAPVELLWNGGIGTYVKGRNETNAAAGDPSNDSVRIDAHELRCAVAGEGGNLGLTQVARVEFALRGGRINTDALDNSGGVDMSDHEVNLKILLSPAVASGKMTAEARNGLLREITDEVADLVLANNRSQAMAVSLDLLRTEQRADDLQDMMFALEKRGTLDRQGESLPTTDVIREREEHGQSLVRPELCVLLAYAKMALKEDLLTSQLVDDPAARAFLRSYFPADALAAVEDSALDEHRLRREIVACEITNGVVDLMGAAFVNRVARDTGRSEAEVVRAWLVASRLSDQVAVVGQLMSPGSEMAAREVKRWLLAVSRVLERTTRWTLANVDPDASPAEIVDRNLEGLTRLRGSFAEIVAGDDKMYFEARVNEVSAAGADRRFAQELITLRFLDQLLEILSIGRATESEVIEVGRAYYQASEAVAIPKLRSLVFASGGEGRWERRAVRILGDTLTRSHRELVTWAVERARFDAASGAADGSAGVADAAGVAGAAGATGAAKVAGATGAAKVAGATGAAGSTEMKNSPGAPEPEGVDGDGGEGASGGGASVGVLLERYGRGVERFRNLTEELRSLPEPGIAAVTVAVYELASLVGSLPRPQDETQGDRDTAKVGRNRLR